MLLLITNSMASSIIGTGHWLIKLAGYSRPDDRKITRLPQASSKKKSNIAING